MKSLILILQLLFSIQQLLLADNKKETSSMIIAIGTTNAIKIQAVEEVIRNYPQLAKAKVETFSVPSGIAEQPLSLEEIITGAKNRAKNAYDACGSCDYSFGIESGLFEANGTQTGFLEASICCIYDGVNSHIGLSCGFEIPPHILALVLDKNRDLAQACYEAGVTANSKLGAAEGLIGILTKGRINRKDNTKQCVTTALIQLENAAWYQEAITSQALTFPHLHAPAATLDKDCSRWIVDGDGVISDCLLHSQRHPFPL